MSTAATVPCPHCGQVVLDDGSLAGMAVSCPGCGGRFMMPGAPPLPTNPPPPPPRNPYSAPPRRPSRKRTRKAGRRSATDCAAIGGAFGFIVALVGASAFVWLSAASQFDAELTITTFLTGMMCFGPFAALAGAAFGAVAGVIYHLIADAN